MLPFCTQPATRSEQKALKNVALSKLKHWSTVTAWAILLRNKEGDKNKRFNDFFPQHSPSSIHYDHGTNKWHTRYCSRFNGARGAATKTWCALKHSTPKSLCRYVGSHREGWKGVSLEPPKPIVSTLLPPFPPCPLSCLQACCAQSQTANETESSARSAELFRTTFTDPPLSCSNTNKLPIYLYYPDAI